MQKNVGTLDQLIRIVVGVFIFLYGMLYVQGIVQWIAYIVGVVLIVTSFTGFCPLYKVLNISTVEKPKIERIAGQTTKSKRASEEEKESEQEKKSSAKKTKTSAAKKSTKTRKRTKTTAKSKSKKKAKK